jgi:hypothetical protein
MAVACQYNTGIIDTVYRYLITAMAGWALHYQKNETLHINLYSNRFTSETRNDYERNDSFDSKTAVRRFQT